MINRLLACKEAVYRRCVETGRKDGEETKQTLKWDGYRALAYVDNGRTELRSRNNKSFNDKFYPVYRALQELPLRAVLDGEIIVANDRGISDFSRLQNWRSEADGELQFHVFDLLWNDGQSLLDLPLSERRTILASLIPKHPVVHVSQSFPVSATEFYKAAEKMGLEGIIAKKADSGYTPGLRSRDWLKIKISKRTEVVIGGFTRNEGSNKPFSALLFGVYEGDTLHYVGKVGTGFSSRLQDELMQKFRPLIRRKNPFDIEPDVNKPSRFRPDPPKADVTWLKPELVCEVSYAEITPDGDLRHPSFKGLRSDKAAKDVHAEKPAEVQKVRSVKKKEHTESLPNRPGKKERKTLLNPTNETQERIIGGHKLKFTNLSKVYWPKEKYTKRDLINYYYQVAPFILPYMKDRPQSMNRHPNGIDGESFYQKDVTGKVPDWVKKYPYFSEADNRQKNFLVCSDEATLLYLASLGCIEMNPWNSRAQTPDNPDWCVIDLDPDDNPFNQVIETAVVTHKILEAADIPSYPKTSGSTGIHIYIPFRAKYSYEQSREFGRLLAGMVHAQLPKFTSIERATRSRKGKIYIDFLQNRPQATLATAYSVRPKPGATVSAPLLWEEVRKGLRIQDFTIANMPSRLRETGDLFKGVLGKAINLKKAVENLAAIET